MNSKEQIKERIIQQARRMKLRALAREYKRAKADNQTEFAAILRGVLAERNESWKNRLAARISP